MAVIEKASLFEQLEISEDKYVWYLGYGSNMCKKTFEGMRRIKPLKSVACQVPNYFLSFDMIGQPYFEPAFASIYPHLLHSHPTSSITYEYAKKVHDHCCPGLPFKFDPQEPEKSLPPTLNGVLYLINKEEYQRILNTEGAGGYDDLEHSYKAIDVECTTYDNQKIIAKTLTSTPTSVKAGCQPSLRYLNLLRTGAKENNLSPAYQAHLNSLKHFEITTVSKKVGRALYAISSIHIFFLFNFAFKISLKYGKRVPKPVARILIFSIKFSMANYNFFLRPLFGSGINNNDV